MFVKKDICGRDVWTELGVVAAYDLLECTWLPESKWYYKPRVGGNIYPCQLYKVSEEFYFVVTKDLREIILFLVKLDFNSATKEIEGEIDKIARVYYDESKNSKYDIEFFNWTPLDNW